MRVFIESINNSWLGTLAFMGDKVNSKEELVSLIKSYAIKETNDGKRYWKGMVKIHFMRESTIDSFIKEGDKQIKNSNKIDLLSLGIKDDLNNVDVIFNPSGWNDKDDNTLFHFLLGLSKSGKAIPIHGNFSAVLEALNITF